MAHLEQQILDLHFLCTLSFEESVEEIDCANGSHSVGVYLLIVRRGRKLKPSILFLASPEANMSRVVIGTKTI